MSNQQVLAEHGVGICILGLGFSTVAAPLSSVALIGVALFDVWRSCRHAKRKAAREAGMARLASLGITDRQAEVALNYLKDYKIHLEVNPASLKDSRTRGAFPQTLYDTLFDPKTIPADDRVPEALFAIVEGAWEVLRLEDDVHKLFTQESLSHLENQFDTRFDALEERLATDIDDLKGLVANLIRQLADHRPQLSATAQTLLDNESFVVALAFRYAEGSQQDFAAALRGLEHALEIAAEERERGKLPTNTDDAVNAIIVQVDALNESGQIETAAALLAEEELRAQAGLIRLYDKGISQAVLTRDVQAAVTYELKKLPMESSEPEDSYRNHCDVYNEWYTRGAQKGLNFDVEVAIALMQHMVTRFREDQDKKGVCLGNLGVALQTLGARESGTARLEEAVTALRAALKELTRDRAPLHWATAQMNLGVALQTLGGRESGTTRLEEAVTAFRAALKELTRDRAPLDWATAQINLGNALQTLGARESGTVRLEEAVAAYRAALEKKTRDREPLVWAVTQLNLGAVLQILGARESGTARLEEAVTALRAALKELTRDQAPLDWATAQMNLGAVLQTLGERERDTARLEEAVTALRAALKEFTRDRVPLHWAKAQMNLGNALQILGLQESGTARLEEAVTACRAALEERTRDRVPADWAKAQMNLGNALQTLGGRERGTTRLEEAVTAYRTALKEFTRDQAPLDWANTVGNEALALLILADRTKDSTLVVLVLDKLADAETVLRECGHPASAKALANQIPQAEALLARLTSPD
ncbi:tetratricopeptide repeat protein [Pseudophaeobacter sp. EL27]|uniref:tetratricopeptide repeat protein n=1 Tax=Pseudophaeobacter sp. EL27 TaxID=2107580 RepID=UPI001C1FCC15|nr:tetratricopeptide repeat protein [Pseudophaeobacter sp. EL27]